MIFVYDIYTSLFQCHVQENKVKLEDITERMEKFDKLITAQHAWLDTCSEKIVKSQTDTAGTRISSENRFLRTLKYCDA